MSSNTSFLYLSLSDPYTRNERKIDELLFQELVKDLRKRLFTSNVRNIITIVLTSITMAPVVIIISALFHQEGVLALLPIIASLFYGITLQLIIVVLKRYASILV